MSANDSNKNKSDKRNNAHDHEAHDHQDAAKQPAEQNATSPERTADEAGVFESLGRRIDEVPKVRAAEDAVRQAQEKLAQAREKYDEARRSAADELSQLREKNVGDLVESASNYVSRHPGQGVLLAALFGFFLGRLFRR
ncbi:MAG: hypothetical protein KDA63_14885 [Planctomycetales bacterium]|nr:hypothetical protein [Planctomycetales bacterium]